MYPTIVTTIVIAMSLLTAVQISTAQQQSQPKANIVNSKFLTIKDQRFRHGDFSDSIIGTVVNNSTQQISFPHVFSVLFDKDNRLISIEDGLVDVSDLKPNEDSAFKIDLPSSLSSLNPPVDHYTLMPGGIPSQ